MLIESFRISESLRQVGVSLHKRHPWVKPLKKGDGIILGMGATGAIESLETISAERLAELSKIEKDNHNSFPAFNFGGPVWRVPADAPAWPRLAVKNITDTERATLIQEACASAELAYHESDLRRLRARLQEFAKELRPLFAARPDPRFLAFKLLLDRITGSELDVRAFLNQFTAASLRAIRTVSCGSPQTVQAVLIGSWNSKKKAVESVSVTALLDVVDSLDMPLRVAHPEMADYFNRVLMSQADHGGKPGTCSLAGYSTVLETDKLPNPKLPILGNTILLSMNPDIACHYRYGMIGADVFPIGKSVASDIQNALQWITSPARAGETWRPIPRNTGDGSDLLITYLDRNPGIGARLADLFSEPSPEVVEHKFEAAARAVSEALDARGDIPDDSILYTTVLRRINKGQVQLELTTQFTVDEIRRGYREWIQAAANHPSFRLPIPQGKGKPAISRSPWTPYPAEVMRSTRSAWLRQGTHQATVTGLPLAQIYDVFLGDFTRAEPSARALLQRTVARTAPLLIRCGHASHGRVDVLKELTPEARKAALLAIAVLSVSLFKMGSKKEEYMSQSAYLIGRMLSLADTLHFEYCKAMRKGQVPPQLLGNALIAMALVNPERSIAQLADRLRVYLGWAGAKGSGLARWVLAQYGEISRELSHEQLDKHLDDAGKAQLLFGYLARPESKEEKNEIASEEK